MRSEYVFQITRTQETSAHHNLQIPSIIIIMCPLPQRRLAAMSPPSPHNLVFHFFPLCTRPISLKSNLFGYLSLNCCCPLALLFPFNFSLLGCSHYYITLNRYDWKNFNCLVQTFSIVSLLSFSWFSTSVFPCLFCP